MKITNLKIYSVVGCDMDYYSDDGNICIYRLHFRTYYVEVEETGKGIYKFDSYGDEFTGNLEEFLEEHENSGDIFSILDDDCEYVYDGNIHSVTPIDDEYYNTKWESEEFFISKEESMKFYNKELESYRHSKDFNTDKYEYFSKPR